ncbi:arylesterase [Christensenellaceae bacterium]|nr:arylesterase [Christensenellaceae bacterium]BDF60407.1 arylesterase [Christensenellaceae bacterium]
MGADGVEKRILCYGDSNTWGYIPGGAGRYGKDVRWTGILANKCGAKAAVIEEGLNGRTTAFDDPTIGGRNGLEGLPSCLEKYAPIHLVILMLGSNDLKTVFHANAQLAADGMRRVVETVARYDGNGACPRILLVSPPDMRESVASAATDFDRLSWQESKRLKNYYTQIACEHSRMFLDAGAVCSASEADGLHLDSEAHARLAESIYAFVRLLLA